MASSDPKPNTAQKQPEEAKPEEKKPEEKKPAAIGEDDEFEDFPVEDWTQEDTEAADGANTKHLWEESWDDDDTTDDFSAQLREELKKVEAAKKR